MKEYKKDLRKNRELKADKMLKGFVTEHGLRKKVLKEMSLVQNKTRGNIFEIMGEVSIANVLGIDDFNKQKIFDTPFGKRRVDLFSKDKGIIIEVKSGYARSRSFIRKQMRKDSYIVKNNPEVTKAVWLLFRGATKPLINYLNKYKIEYFDMEYDLTSSEKITENPIISNINE